MLAKKERLSKSDFSRFFSSGKRLHSPLFTLIFSPHKTSHGSVVVSKKVARRAVDRNRMRRRIYDMLRGHLRGGAPAGVYILLVKKAALSATYDELKEALDDLIKKV